MQLTFKPPGPVAREFMRDDLSFVRILIGPVGSAKSSSTIMEMMRRQIQQTPNKNNERRSRWAIIRNTNPMLSTTVMKTYEDWWKPEVFGEPKMAPPPYRHEIDLDLGDGTRLQAENIFLALDTADDVRKLLSLELTGALISEVREIDKAIIDGVTQRCRRFPAMKDGGSNWSGVICDTNMPDDDHWLAIMSGLSAPPEGMSEDEINRLVKPRNWSFFIQPPAMLEARDANGKIAYRMNPVAENVENLHPDYYVDMIEGKKKGWVDVYILNKLGATHDGRPVQSEFSREVHVAREPLRHLDGHTIHVGVDFGLTPAAVFFQRAREQILVLDEIVLVDADAGQLAAAIKRKCLERFPDSRVLIWGDPAGDHRAGTDKSTPFLVLRKNGLTARAVETNDPEIRRGALSGPLQRMTGGMPAILFDPRCKVLISGYEGAWFYKRVRGSSGQYEDEPSKNRYSHVCEAGEYGLMGMGEGRRVTHKDRDKNAKAKPAFVRPNPMERFGRARRR